MYNILIIENINSTSILILNEISVEITNAKIFKITSDIDEIATVLKNHLVDFIIIDEKIEKIEAIIQCIKYYSYDNRLFFLNNNVFLCIKEIKKIISNDFENYNSLKHLISEELKKMNFNFSYVGTRYLVDVIYESYYRCENFDINLNSDIYPILSKKYNKTINNIKSNIHYSANMMYCETESSQLERKIGLCIDFKPKLKDIIISVIRKI